MLWGGRVVCPQELERTCIAGKSRPWGLMKGKVDTSIKRQKNRSINSDPVSHPGFLAIRGEGEMSGGELEATQEFQQLTAPKPDAFSERHLWHTPLGRKSPGKKRGHHSKSAGQNKRANEVPLFLTHQRIKC